MACSRLSTVSLLAILWAWLACALDRPALASASAWNEVSTSHFTVLTDAPEKQGRQIADQLERMRWMFHTLFPRMNVDPADPIAVIAIRNYKEFQALEPPEYLAKGQMRLGGLFLKTQDRNYVLLCLDAEEEHPYATVYHEYTHLMFSGNSDWMPLWLDEGLAEFIQNTDIHDKNVQVGQPSAADILYLRQNQLMPLDVLFRVDHNSPYYHEEQKGSVFYAESWALTHYLEIDDHDRHLHQLDDYLTLMSRHADPVEAAQKAFGDLKQLQASLAAYVRDGRYKQFVLNSAAAPLDEASYKVRPVPQSEADAERAAFLAQVGRKQDALTLLASVLEADPKCAQCYETRGYLAFRDGDLESARKWYGEAVKLDSRSYLANYYFAAMSAGKSNPGESAAIESSLRHCIQLKPGFAPAYDALAILFAQERRNLDEAYTLETRAIQLDRANFGYRINTGSILLAQGKYTDAMATLQMAENLAKTPRDRELLESNLQAARKMLEAHDHMTFTTVTTNATAGDPASQAQTPVQVAAIPPPRHPAETPSGPKREALGTIRKVECTDPAFMDFQLVSPQRTLKLYAANYYKLDMTALGFTPKAEVNPCRDIEGFKARVTYTASGDKSVDGLVVAVELRK